MIILINKNFSMIRTGAYVTADEKAGEFIVDTDNCTLSNAVLFEVAQKNKVEISKKASKSEVLAALAGATGKLPTMDEKPKSLVVAEIIQKWIDEGKDIDDEDGILYQIVTGGHGIKFKDAPKLFNQAMIDGGHRVSSKDRYESIKIILIREQFNPSEYSQVDKMCERLTKEVELTEYSQAYSAIRKYAKEFDITLPKPEKKVSAGGLKAKIFAWMEKNPLADKNAFYSYIVEGLEKEEKLADKYYTYLEQGQKIAKATIALQSE